MANTIRLKRGSGSDPSASDLVVGEVAVRTDEGKLFTKKDDGTVAEISGGGGIDDGDKGDITVSNSGATFTIDSGVITNAKISGSAAIAGSKISPSFTSDITIAEASPSILFSDVSGSPQNPDYRISVNSGKFEIYDETNSTTRLLIDSSGNIGIGNSSPDTNLHLTGDTPKFRIESTNSLQASAGTEEIGRIEFEGTKGSNINVAASMRVRQDGTWSTSDDFFSPTAIEFYTQDQSGTEVTTPRLTLDSNGHVRHTGNLFMPDSSSGNIGRIKLGGGEDLQIYHNGSQSFIDDAGSGALRIRSNQILFEKYTGENLAKFTSDGAIELYFDNTKRIETAQYGAIITGTLELTSHLDMGDDDRIKLGDSDDLEIYHNTHGSINNKTGNLYIQNNVGGDVGGDIHIRAKSGENSISCLDDGEVKIYHDNVEKFRSTSYGAEFFGDAGIARTAGGYTFREVAGGDERAGIKSNSSNDLIINVGGAAEAARFTQSSGATFLSSLTIGDGSAQTELLIKKADNNVSDHLQFYNGTTRMGEIGCEDTTWLRINQETNKNIYTPRIIRADGGFQVDGSTVINGSGSYVRALSGASDYDTLLRSNAADTASGDITFSGGAGAVTIAANSDIRFVNGSSWTGNTTAAKITLHNNVLYVSGGSSGIIFRENASNRWIMDGNGHFRPAVDSTYDIGSTSVKVRVGYFDELDSAEVRVNNGILEVKSEIAASHTLTSGYNAMAVDPTVNSGVTVTVPSGAVWAIV